MVFSAIVPEMFVYGFAPTVLSHNPWFGPAAAWFIWSWWGSSAHRFDLDAPGNETLTCPKLIMSLMAIQGAALFIGMLVGLAFLYATDFPRLLDFDFGYASPQRSHLLGGGSLAIDDAKKSRREQMDGESGMPWRVKPYVWNVFSAFSFVFIGISIHVLAGQFTRTSEGGKAPENELTANQALAIGLTLLIVGIIGIIAWLAVTCGHVRSSVFPDGHLESGHTNVKWLFFVGLYVSLALFYDFSFTSSIHPWGKWAIIVGGAILLIIIFFGLVPQDRYIGSVSGSRLAWTLVVFELIHATVYMSAPIADCQFQDPDFGAAPMFPGPECGAGNPSAALAIVGGIGAFWFFALLIAGACLRASRVGEWRDDVNDRRREYMKSEATREYSVLEDESVSTTSHSMTLRRRRNATTDYDESSFDL